MIRQRNRLALELGPVWFVIEEIEMTGTRPAMNR